MLLIKKNSFTLIEMLLVISVVAIISLTIYATFNNGMKLWQRANRYIPEEDVNISFDKFATDLRNAFKFTGINFTGTEDKIEFPTLVNSASLKNRTVGRVRYFYESGSGILSREQSDYSQVYTSEGSQVQAVLRNIKSLKFRYYVFDKETKVYSWQGEWTKEGLPLAVRLEVEFEYDSQGEKFTKTVNIPCSG
jgi:prepilin-type N-terminal cleavage/methylation domain-containing protein